MQIIFTALMILLVHSASYGSQCKAVAWPFSKDIKNLQPISYQAIPRDHLYKYLYFELSSPAPARTKGLASRLLFYLKNTELNEDKYHMLMALEWAAELQSKTPRPIPIAEICAMENKINRVPSSTKKPIQKIQKKQNRDKRRN